MAARLAEKYKAEIVPALIEEFAFVNPMAVPRLEKVVITMGLGQFGREAARLETAMKELGMIAGQKPVVCKARVSISNFKLRAGMNVGLKVTLRRQQMYEFLDRLMMLAIPRVKDFRGLNPNAFDGRGNYNMGLSEQTLFPEIDPDKVQHTQGMNIAIATTAGNDEQARRLLAMLGMPFRSVQA
ncbi:MAG: 50S ribosomal protein L5 [Planctomycetes bacterium]|nr:50S ribosomal protein L5 [Planctomycetota bacterium]